jgi:hypothetical protein
MLATVQEKLKDVCFYVVVNSDGQFFCNGGYASIWVDDISNARVYNNIGPARSMVTFIADYYPGLSVPSIVKLSFSAVEILDEKDRVNKAKVARVKKKQRSEIRRKKEALARAEKDLIEAKRNFDKLSMGEATKCNPRI